MTFSHIQNGFSAGEISPRLFGRTDLAKYHLGCSTLRNFYVDYRGGASSRAGFAYVGMCKQAAPNSGGTSTNNPPRDIPFQFSISQGYALEFGDLYMRIKTDGAYVTETGKNITGATKANPLVLTIPSHGFLNDQWVYIASMGGMTNLNGLTWLVAGASTNTIQVKSLFNAAINSTNFTTYTSGGTASRIYTVTSPYAAVDLPFLKYTQSADTMTLTCVNQQTNTEYPSYELVRSGATSWAFTVDTFSTSVSAPRAASAVANASTTLSTYYSYVVTAVSATTGEESVASPVATVQNNDIAINAGSNVVTWSSVVSVTSYNIYASTPSYAVPVPTGAAFGYIGSAFGNQFTDTNIIADFTTVPPIHNDPFSRGQISGVTATAFGYSYTQANVSYNITTSTGSGAVIVPVVVNGGVVAYIVQNGGKSYANGDTIAITSATGHNATATLNVGAATGTYPSVCAYFQQRRGYANTINAPDTYFFSQPGAFSNMDASVPVTDSDSITGAPWAQQINGIQFMVPMNPGLIILTGSGAWLLNGGNSPSFTPIDQTAAPQSFNGCNFHIQPLVINLDILYVQAKGSIVRDLAFNFFQNIFTGTDTTVLSEHLFNFHQLQQWAWAEEPFKIAWAARDDGVMLSFTYLKEQDVYGWARHDTNGIFIDVCSVTEPPTDAVYAIVKRYIQGPAQWVYYAERMDNRNWLTVEDCFCVDAGLSLTKTFPNATLTPSAINGTSNISSLNLIAGGTGYTAPTIAALDPTGEGSGFAATLTLTTGVVTGYTISSIGTDYQPGTEMIVTDTTGSGAVLAPIITNNVIFTADSGVFTSANIGDVIRIGNNNASTTSGFAIAPNGGGKATITSFTSTSIIVANITSPITNIIPDDPNETPVPISPNYWSLSTPVSSVSGLNHLEGMEVAILADGSVVANQTVSGGSIDLPASYSAVTVGLPFTAQLQTLYLDPPAPSTTQGKRKNLQAVTVRVENTRGISVGTNQPDASTQPNGQAPAWEGMYEMKQRNPTQAPGTAIPLFTGDLRELVGGDWAKPGQVAIQQNYPLPCNALAVIPEFSVGDTNG